VSSWAAAVILDRGTRAPGPRSPLAEGEPDGPEVYILRSRDQPQSYCAARQILQQIPNISAVVDRHNCLGDRKKTVTLE